MNYSIFIYLLYWIILSERFTMEGIIVGSFITLIVLYFNKDSLKNISFKKVINLKALKYWSLFVILLIKEIIKANFHVAKIVLSPKLRIAPVITGIKTDVKSEMHRVILGNSITLTPGTLTISLKNNELLVHCLEEESIKGVFNCNLERIIMKAEE